MDAIEQLHRFLSLAGLQLPDQVQLGAIVCRFERGPFCHGFLHPVLAKHALSCGNQRLYRFGGMGFADGNEGDVRHCTLRHFRGMGDAIVHTFEQGGWLIHGALL